jgi:hypothetical protein
MKMEQSVTTLSPSVSSEGDSDANRHQPGAEETCTRVEGFVRDALLALKTLATALKKLEGAATDGDFQEMRRSSDVCMALTARLKVATENAAEVAQFAIHSALSSGSYSAEVLDAARAIGLTVHEKGNLLFCFPQIVRVLPDEASIAIGRKRDNRLRPSELVRRLQQEQRKPQRLKPQQFLQLLYKAYLLALPSDLPKSASGFVAPLARIYDLLTIFPGTSKEYSVEEFSRDVYLLDKSGISTTKDNAFLSFSASSGTRVIGDTFVVVTETGAEIAYYGISFTTTPTGNEL